MGKVNKVKYSGHVLFGMHMCLPQEALVADTNVGKQHILNDHTLQQDLQESFHPNP